MGKRLCTAPFHNVRSYQAVMVVVGGLSACKGIHLWCYVRGYLRHHMTPERFLVLSDKQMSGYTVSEANFLLLYINHLPLSLYR